MSDNDFKDIIANAKSVPIEALLGYPVSEEILHGRIKKYSSPFSNDSDPSFVVYPSNSYYDYSTGEYGDAISLVMKLENIDFTDALNMLNNDDNIKFTHPSRLPKLQTKYRKKFDLNKYLTKDKAEQKAIRKYAHSRGITDNYFFGRFFTVEGRYDEETPAFLSHPSIGFRHVDYDLNTIGMKFRVLPGDTYRDRFSARGKLGIYVCENILSDSYSDTILYIVESESSANSLWMYCKENNINAVVISGGGVTFPPKFIPKIYEKYKRKIIIDYDGSDLKYQKRCKMYERFNGEYIKLILPKGEDINSLFAKGKVGLIKNLIL